MPIHDELRETMRRGLVSGQYGAVRNGIRYIEERTRAALVTAEDGVELLRSARYDWTRVPYDNILVRHPHPRYWALRQELARATLHIAKGRRWEASTNRAPPIWKQCTLGDPFDAPASICPCHVFTYAKTRRRPGWTLDDAVREFRRASSNRYHGDGGACALLAEEIAEIVQHSVLDNRGNDVTARQPLVDADTIRSIHSIIATARDDHVRKSRHSGMWMPSFQRYCQWWQQLFDVALMRTGNTTIVPEKKDGIP